MDPAPIPRGMAQTQSQRKWFEQENPSRAAAVKALEKAETLAVPKAAMILVLKRLERTVQLDTVAEIKLTYETGTCKSP